MTVVASVNSRSVAFGLSKEANRGTPETAPRLWLPTEQGGSWMPKFKDMETNETRGSRTKPTQRRQGYRYYEAKKKGVVYDDMALPLFLSTFGKYTTSQPDVVNAATAYQYDITLEEKPTLTFTAFEDFWQEDDETDVYTWAVVNKLDLKFNMDSFLTWDADWMATKHSKLTGARPATSYTDTPAYAGFEASVTRNGVTFELLTDSDWSISNGYAPFKGSDGTREATRLMAGDFMVAGKATILGSRADWEYLESDPNEPWVFTWTGALLGGTTHRQIKLTLPKVGYKSYAKDDSKTEVMLKLDMVAEYSRTDLTSAKMQIITDIDPATL